MVALEAEVVREVEVVHEVLTKVPEDPEVLLEVFEEVPEDPTDVPEPDDVHHVGAPGHGVGRRVARRQGYRCRDRAH